MPLSASSHGVWLQYSPGLSPRRSPVACLSSEQRESFSAIVFTLQPFNKLAQTYVLTFGKLGPLAHFWYTLVYNTRNASVFFFLQVYFLKISQAHHGDEVFFELCPCLTCNGSTMQIFPSPPSCPIILLSSPITSLLTCLLS